MAAFAPRPLLCLITDRVRLTGTADPGRSLGAVVAQVAGAARAGVDLVQIRERDLASRDLAALVERCVDALGPASTRVLVNERADVAIAAGAHGVHLRSDSMDATRLRAMVPPGFLLGRSVHSEAEAVTIAARGGLDYLLLGSVFETASKGPGHSTLGLDPFRRLAGRVSVPVVAIGGITLARLPQVIRAGAAGAAAIGLFVGAAGSDPAAATAEAVARARAALGGAAGPP